MNREGHTIDDLKEIVQLRPNDFVALWNLAQAYMGLNATDELTGVLRAMLQLDPSNIELYYHLGVTHDFRKEWKEAIMAYKRVITAAPDHSAEVYINLGADYVALGEYEYSIEAYKNVFPVS